MKAITFVKDMDNTQHIVSKLCDVASTSLLPTDQNAQIKAFSINFKRFAQTPKYIHLIIQPEFHFVATIDTYICRLDLKELTELKWPKRVFITIDHTLIEEWLKIIIDKTYNECDLIAALLPARTSIACFSEYVLKFAKEVRFLRGLTTTVSNDGKKNTEAYCIALFYKNEKVREKTLENNSSCSIISFATSATSNEYVTTII